MQALDEAPASATTRTARTRASRNIGRPFCNARASAKPRTRAGQRDGIATSMSRMAGPTRGDFPGAPNRPRSERGFAVVTIAVQNTRLKMHHEPGSLFFGDPGGEG